MADQQTHYCLIEELNARQDEVLQQIDELNGQIESLLKQCTARDQAEPSSQPAPTDFIWLPRAVAGLLTERPRRPQASQ